MHDQALLERPGIDEVMLDLFKDCGTNVALYPQFQGYLRDWQPPTLIVRGKNDSIFPADGALAALMRKFLDRNLRRRQGLGVIPPACPAPDRRAR